MDQKTFTSRFNEAAELARRFAQDFILEHLPPDLRFHVHLNQSYDGTSSEAFQKFPEDSKPEVGLTLRHVDASDVIRALWRDGLIPQWIDVSVVGETGAHTVIEVLACGRFTADEGRLYHVHEGRPPFHVTSPTHPAGHVSGQRFSIYNRSSCWTHSDLERVQANSLQVWSLELNGPAFSDELLTKGLKFPALHILELHGTLVTGPGLASLIGLPSLRYLRIWCGPIRSLDLSRLPVLHQVAELSLYCLPASVVSWGVLGSCLPNLTDLSLSSTFDITAQQDLPALRLGHLTLEFPVPPHWARQATGTSLSLHFPQANDDDIVRMIEGAPHTLESVGLRGTPVTDAIFTTLARVSKLRYVDLVRTRITQAALDNFVAVRPGLNYWPRRASSPEEPSN